MMEGWPAVAWLLLMTNIADWLKPVQSRDFTTKDIILLHPSTTPHPGAFKCFTCQQAVDNYECNRWAPDVYCPKDTRYCHTLHMMDNHGDSVSVTKRCATLEDCLFTGCASITGNGRVCSSCCEGNICNVLLPRNDSSAVFTRTSPLVSSSRELHPAALSYIIIIIIIISILLTL
ncbi:ly6/PLAUR domain-containing protein 6-like isoform X2 [Seriola lalandi dorsalis]|uniref:LY6/PLAUR domain containing 6 n=1 Tax=Seriola lalandi dorsalis TaxID=1841481 RepID=A0A3B4WXD8_SERLL|nr:ly6/PLAUR domain-containing protein 6-like isoform X2 [Seriola lalandi dorsalis]XP_056226511.1 ly6/PLAUR domain-containing protein 6-like [Seriola aureovittata]XP_056226512.1 ly6/PLAUR domain-containing protein 6-like [Seriola aureovittata]